MKVDDIKVYADNISDSVINEGMAVNSTASIDFSDVKKPQVLGNPTEGALLLWLNNKGVDYRMLRESVNVVQELPFSTERKYMATVVESAVIPGKKILYVKGAPEIIFDLCKVTNVDKTIVDKQLISYQEPSHAYTWFCLSSVGKR